MKPKKIYKATNVDIDKIKYYLIYFLDDDIINYKLHNTEYESTIMEVICKNGDNIKRMIKFNSNTEFIKLWYRIEKHRNFYGFIIFNITIL